MMSEVVLPVALALAGVAAAWLHCFDRAARRITRSGWLIVAAIVILTVASSIDSQRTRADNEELNANNDGLEL